MTTQCPHGQLARVCLTCEHEATIAALTHERDQLRTYLDFAHRRAQEIADEAAMLRAERDAAAADRDALLVKRDALQAKLTESALQVLAHSTQAHEAWEDAERYRWLKSQELDDPEIWIAVDSAKVPGRWADGGDEPDDCDTAIDAARKAAP